MQIEPLRFSFEDQAAESEMTAESLNGIGDPTSGITRFLPVPAISAAIVSSEASPCFNVAPAHDAGLDIAVKRPPKSRGAYELKFLIDEGCVPEIMDWARQHLDADPNFDPEFGDSYRVNSLYLDTPQFDVFHRMSGFRQQKYRLRRYGRESLVWLEQKRKGKGLVRKRRVSVNEADISTRLILAPEPEWDGNWFRKKVDEQMLRPVCQITYQRFARVKPTDDGLMRLTIDNHLVACAAGDWRVPTEPLDGVSLLEGQRILELKFRGAMPGLFRRLIEQQRLQVTRFSKYRTSVEECVPLDSLAGEQT